MTVQMAGQYIGDSMTELAGCRWTDCALRYGCSVGTASTYTMTQAAARLGGASVVVNEWNAQVLVIFFLQKA